MQSISEMPQAETTKAAVSSKRAEGRCVVCRVPRTARTPAGRRAPAAYSRSSPAGTADSRHRSVLDDAVELERRQDSDSRSEARP